MPTATSEIQTILDASPEEVRRTHLWFLESMDRVHRAIQGTDDLEQMMSDVLGAVLDVFECDRALLAYPCNPETAFFRVPMGRTRPEYPCSLSLGVEYPGDEDVRRVFGALRAAPGPQRLGAGMDHPVPAHLAERFGVQSALVMAVYPKVDEPYQFTLHQCSAARVWTPEEVRLFEEIGRRLADGLTTMLIVRNLRESEGRLDEAQRITHVTYADRDLDTGHIKTSDEGYRILGLPLTHRPLTVADVIERAHPDDRDLVTRAITEARHGGHYDIEYRVVQPTGDVRIVHSRGDVIRDESGRPRRSVGVVRDVTEHKRAEYLTRQVFENSPDGIAIVGRDYLFQRVNPVYERLWRMPTDTIVGMSVAEVIGADIFERRAKPNLDRCFAGEDVRYSAWLDTAYGRLYAVVSYTPLRPSTERVEAALVIINDFTEHMLAQEALQKAQAELAHMARVTTLAEIGSSIAHEVNQPLAAIVMSGNACRRWLAADPPNIPEARDAVQRIVNDGNRASQVVGRIRSLMRRGEPVSEALNVNELIRETVALVRTELARHEIVVDTDLRAVSVNVAGDHVQLQQVLVNLILNSADAMRATDRERRVLTLRSGSHSGGGIVVDVEDAGVGLAAEHADKIFDAFFSTKTNGLGIGLSISRSIIEAHGGRLWATANAGPGATFHFTLPPTT